MDREKSLKLVKNYVKNENSIKHMLAVEAVMRALAERFGEDKDLWGLTGLVHDIDMEIVDYRNNPELHGKKGVEILKNENFSEEVTNAVLAHNKKTGKSRDTLLEKAIYCTDPLTGLIVASVLVLQSKKIEDLSTSSVLRRFKEKSFAKGADREVISACSEIGLTLEEFVEVGVSAMQKINKELEL
ncbi:MAG: HDIG domain-containing protein [Candidatus Pacebacteria bacterium]|nr:HDIG domain-containing protein [Candidatus Paceibacterota bacterium]